MLTSKGRSINYFAAIRGMEPAPMWTNDVATLQPDGIQLMDTPGSCWIGGAVDPLQANLPPTCIAVSVDESQVNELVAAVRAAKIEGLVAGEAERPKKKNNPLPPAAQIHGREEPFLDQYLKAIRRQTARTAEIFSAVDQFCEGYAPDVEPICKQLGIASDRVFSSTQKGRFTPEGALFEYYMPLSSLPLSALSALSLSC